MITATQGIGNAFLTAVLVLVLTLPFQINLVGQSASKEIKPRIIVTADPELDDNNSLIRFILYSAELDIEGLIYASSQFHWKGDGKGTRWFVPGREYDRFKMNECPCTSWRWAEGERFIHDIVEAYEKGYPNLKIHNSGYSSPEYLKSKIRYGNIEFDGDYSKDTPGSELIKAAILDNEPGKLFITAWGGASTIARALKSIQDQYEMTTQWEAIKNKINRKVVLLPSGDQDNTIATYILPNWPGIEHRSFRESPHYGYGAQIRATEANAPLLTPAWMKANVLDRGALGKLYRVWGDSKQMVKGDKVDYFGLAGYSTDELKKMGYFVWMPPQEKGSWLGEGDNATFMNMLGNGLRAWESGEYGGWGGRASSDAQRAALAMFNSEGTADDMANSLSTRNTNGVNAEVPFPDFFLHAQHSFATRLKWAVTPLFKDANHEPKVSIISPQKIIAAAKQKVKLYGLASDPDGNEVTVKWWQMPAGTYTGKVIINHANTLQAELEIPEDVKGGQTIHVILEVTDNGVPALTGYKRVIVEISVR